MPKESGKHPFYALGNCKVNFVILFLHIYGKGKEYCTCMEKQGLVSWGTIKLLNNGQTAQLIFNKILGKVFNFDRDTRFSICMDV